MSSKLGQNPELTEYTLSSELYRDCLPKNGQDAGRKVIWMNTLCILMLSIGILGVAHPIGLVLHPLQESDLPQVIEILQSKPDEKVPQESSEEPAPLEETSPQPVQVQPLIVAGPKAVVAFAVEVMGPVIISKDPNFAVPPPREIRRSAAPAQSGPLRLRAGGGEGSFFPKPSSQDYPREALKRREQGAGEFLIRIGLAGEITELKIIASSGSSTLDNAFRQWIRKHYKFGPDYFGKQVIAEFEYRIR